MFIEAFIPQVRYCVNRRCGLFSPERANRFQAVNTLSVRLKNARKAKGLTQVELAQLAGLCQQMVSDIERGRSRSARDLVKLAKALDVSADFLLGAESDEFSDEIYDLIMSLSPERREDALAILRTLAGRTPRQP